jgi:hypothetical protein
MILDNSAGDSIAGPTSGRLGDRTFIILGAQHASFTSTKNRFGNSPYKVLPPIGESMDTESKVGS